MDLHFLYLLNHWVGRSAEIDSVLRFLAVWGPLWAAWEVARPWLNAEEPSRCGRITRNAVLSGLAALLLALLLSRLKARTRPFLSLPVVLLYLTPNNSSFPDLVIALGVGVTLGAIYYQRRRWWFAGIVTLLWVLARMMSGTMFPSDGLVAALIGALPVMGETLIARLPLSRKSARAGAMALAVGFAGVAWGIHATRPHRLPPLSSMGENLSAVHSPEPVRSVGDPRLKGFIPDEEEKILQVTDALVPPPPVLRVEVGSDRWIKVAGVKLLAGDHWDSRSRAVTTWQAARTLKAILLKRPGLSEVDLWAVVPFTAPKGKEALRPVLFVQARRSKGDVILKATSRQLYFGSEKLLASTEALYVLEKEFPQGTGNIPSGVAEGAG